LRKNNFNKEISNLGTDQLLNLGKQLLSINEIDKILELSIDQAIDLAKAERGLIILFDSEGEIIFEKARNLNKNDVEHPKFEVSRTIINKVKTSGEPLFFHNAKDAPFLDNSVSIIRLKILSVICVPLIFQKKYLASFILIIKVLRILLKMKPMNL